MKCIFDLNEEMEKTPNAPLTFNVWNKNKSFVVIYLSIVAALNSRFNRTRFLLVLIVHNEKCAFDELSLPSLSKRFK